MTLDERAEVRLADRVSCEIKRLQLSNDSAQVGLYRRHQLFEHTPNGLFLVVIHGPNPFSCVSRLPCLDCVSREGYHIQILLCCSPLTSYTRICPVSPYI